MFTVNKIIALLLTLLLTLSASMASATTSYETADQELNQAYQTIVRELNQMQKASLRQAQRAWISFRDAECAHQAAVVAATAAEVTKQNCLAQLTALRTNELRTIYPALFPDETVTLESPFTQSSTVYKDKPRFSKSKNLVGDWQTLDGNMAISFSVLQDGRTLFSSWLNQRPSQSGVWELVDNQLLLSSSDGEPLHIYNQVVIENDRLTLFEQGGGEEIYQRVK